MNHAQHETENLMNREEEIAPAENLAVEESSTPPLDPAYERRRRRIYEHRVEAQAESHTMIACLAGVNSDLLDCELVIAETLRQAWSASDNPLEAVVSHEPQLDLLLRLVKQITQVTQLEQRCRKEFGSGAAESTR